MTTSHETSAHASPHTSAARLAQSGSTEPDDLYATFLDWATGDPTTGGAGLTLYAAQDEAILELVTGANVVLATPTGSGKSLVAVAAHFFAFAQGKRSVYTAPIKALVSEKFFALCEVFGSDNVGMMTGDAAVNPDAPILCATAEVLANIALRIGSEPPPGSGWADLGLVIMDEFHYYADPDRGWAWQVPLLELTSAQFLLMSATLGDTADIEADLARRTARSTVSVAGGDRPVPLHHYYALTPLHETITDLLAGDQAPIYVVHFTQAAALEHAQALTSIAVASRAERDLIAEVIAGFRFNAGFGKTLNRLVRHGIGVHHAGMLPKYRRLVEQLAQRGLLKVICGTDTLGVGINVPIRTVVLAALSKYDGQRTRQLQVREYLQISGRAGRAGFDTAGTVVVQAPEHEVENARLLAKAGDDEKKRRRIVRKKAPDGFVSWSKNTHERLQTNPPEQLVPQFTVTPAMLLNVIARGGDTFTAMRHLIMDNHTPGRRRDQVRDAIRAYRSLLVAEVIERDPDDPRRLSLTADLPVTFALNQPLSTFALAALDLLDTESETYALDAISVLESTLEGPRQVLSAQRNRERGEAVAAMKADGIEYEERMVLLEDVTHPQPLVELLGGAFAIYRGSHPWLNEDQLTPKSIVRDMWERAMTFGEYVAFYGLTRSEGALLRYLSDAYRALRSGVPDHARTEGLDDIVEWLGETVRQTDSSLLDEWEQLVAGRPDDLVNAVIGPAARPAPATFTSNVRAFTIAVRNALFRRVELAALHRNLDLGELDADAGWDADRWRAAIDAYFDEYNRLGTGPDARNPALVHIDTSPRDDELDHDARAWRVRQVFDDPDGDRDWGITAVVDLAASDEAGEPVIRLIDVGPLTV